MAAIRVHPSESEGPLNDLEVTLTDETRGTLVSRSRLNVSTTRTVVSWTYCSSIGVGDVVVRGMVLLASAVYARLQNSKEAM